MTDKRIVLLVMLAGAVWVSLAAVAGREVMAQPTVLAALPLLQDPTPASRRSVNGEFPSFGGATGWINSPPLTATGLRGKVVLVDFWTYSCINWRRELPYVRAWASKYKDQGLVVIGVHAPEFAFEKDADNVRRAARDIGVDYPIAIDSEHAIWRSFGNAYWPALYFIDAQGHVRHHHYGEGDYDESERVIKRMLSEAGATGIGPDLASVDGRGAEAPPDWENLKSPETYVGYGRTENFASVGGAVADRRHVYTAPVPLKLNQWALSGDWIVHQQAVLSSKAEGRIAYRFQRPRPSPRDGSGSCRDARAIPGLHRRQASRCSAWHRRGRARQRHGVRASAIPVDPATQAHPRSPLRNRISRSSRGGLLLHVRLICLLQWSSTSTTAWAKACGASWGRLWPMPPPMTRCEYGPENFLA